MTLFLKNITLAYIKSEFEDKWVSVLFVPKAATTILSWIWAKIQENKLNVISFQESLISLQISFEKMVEDIAKQYKWKVLIVLDRWILDSKAYMEDKKELDKILSKYWLKEENILSERYDWIIHMVTAANWAEEFYTLENNSARSETVTEAIILDEKIKKVYIWTPTLSVIDNSWDFKTKLSKVGKQIYHILWIPEPIERENKYLIKIKDFDKLLSISRKVNIEQIYLSEKWAENEERVRSRAVDGIKPTYFHTIKRKFWDDRIKTERIINSREYLEFIQRWIAKIEKIRYCFFIWMTIFWTWFI